MAALINSEFSLTENLGGKASMYKEVGCKRLVHQPSFTTRWPWLHLLPYERFWNAGGIASGG